MIIMIWIIDENIFVEKKDNNIINYKLNYILYFNGFFFYLKL